MTFYDISPLISEKTAVWPGDCTFSRSCSLELAKGDNIDLSAIKTTLHIGAHADAPSHTGLNGCSIDLVELEVYWGYCSVVRTSVKGRLIEPDDLQLPEGDKIERILVHTGSFPDPNYFNEDFVGFAPETVAWLGSKGLKLLGIDTPSVDPFASKDLPAHAALRKAGIANLEGLVLDSVPPGDYELSALPLKISGADASPIRAVLRSLRS